jgi:citrate/tricarballylate utilization protein
MPPLAELVEQAKTLPALPETPETTEAIRLLTICNACRYCEGYCAMFQSMTRRLEFNAQDAHYLANLCHNCGACLHACQYAPPHEFGVDVPRALARVRVRTYADYAWPRVLGGLYRSNGLAVAMATTLGLVLFLLLAVARNGTLWHPPMAGNFYAIFPHNLMVAIFGSVFGFALLALGIGVAKFWRDQSPGRPGGAAIAEATHDVMRLKYLDGGHGEGCNEADDRPTLARRRCHHLVFYGFLLCFASTSVATLYHYVLGLQAPYPVLSLPVILGTVGGVMLAIGCAGLFVLHGMRAHNAPEQRGMDLGLIGSLFLVAVTGLALLALRDTGAMALLLAIHLGCVLALFVLIPYGKLAHGAYRGAALLKWTIEKRRPRSVGAAGD